MNPPVRGISSMATRSLLAELGAIHRRISGVMVAFEAVGGVEVPRRLRHGEPVDVVVLASMAIQRLADEALVVAATQKAFAVSPAALAVRAGADKPSIDTAESLVRTLRTAASIGYSTGPSGDALRNLLDCAGILPEVRPRLLQAAPGVPVARLIAEGRAEIGLQQLSELAAVDGIEVVGTLPEELHMETIFSAAIGASARQAGSAQAFLDFLGSPEAGVAINRALMSPYPEADTAGGIST